VLVTETTKYTLGEGPLTYTRVLRQASGMFRRHHWRVALVALILFVPPPLLAVVLERWSDSLEVDPGLIRGLVFIGGVLVATMIRLFGPVVYAGYLDEAVGHEYFHGGHVRFREVLRSLPWVRLIVADIILVVGTGIGLSLLVVPGIIWLTLFTLIGPVLVQERHGVIDGFRRTYQLSRGAWKMILLLVVALLAVENFVHEAVHELFHHEALWMQVASSWVIAAIIGGIVGLVEVALASELMARSPMEPSEAD
jgi:hypothetical protein